MLTDLNGLGSLIDIQFAIQSTNMAFHGRNRYMHAGAYFIVVQTFADQQQHLNFFRRH